jgi:hypothetical protein
MTLAKTSRKKQEALSVLAREIPVPITLKRDLQPERAEYA